MKKLLLKFLLLSFFLFAGGNMTMAIQHPMGTELEEVSNNLSTIIWDIQGVGQVSITINGSIYIGNLHGTGSQQVIISDSDNIDVVPNLGFIIMSKAVTREGNIIMITAKVLPIIDA